MLTSTRRLLPNLPVGVVSRDTFQTFFKKVRFRDSETHKYFCITKDQVTTMVVFLLPEDKERWGQDLHRTTDAFVCVVTKDRKTKVMG